MKRLLLTLLLAMPLLVSAKTDIDRIDIVAVRDNTALMQLAGRIENQLQQSRPGVAINIRDSRDYRNKAAASTLVITIGDSSLPWLREHRDDFAAAIAFHVSSTQFDARSLHAQHVTALYRDQPLARQLRLAKLLLPNLRRVTLLSGTDEPGIDIDGLQQNSGVGIAVVNTDKDPDWLKSLSQALRNSDALLGIDDPDVYNGNTIRGILLTTYRHGKGLIGPSRVFVGAGSLASCYTTSNQYLQQLASMVKTVLASKRLPPAQYPQEYHVAINKQVANSLNVPIPDEDTLSARLHDHTGDCGDGC